MEHFRLLFISVLAVILTSCASPGAHPIEPATYQVVKSELPRELHFEAYSHQPFTLLFVPEPHDSPVLPTRLFSISFKDHDGKLIESLTFTDDSCNSLFSFSLTEVVNGEIHTQYFDDSLPGTENLEVSVFEGEDASGTTQTFIGVNDVKLPSPRANRIRQVSVSISHPITMSTTNLVELERK